MGPNLNFRITNQTDVCFLLIQQQSIIGDPYFQIFHTCYALRQDTDSTRIEIYAHKRRWYFIMKCTVKLFPTACEHLHLCMSSACKFGILNTCERQKYKDYENQNRKFEGGFNVIIVILLPPYKTVKVHWERHVSVQLTRHRKFRTSSISSNSKFPPQGEI